MKQLQSYPLKFQPIPKESIWGGEKLKDYFKLKAEGPVGEVWTLSDHKNSVSVCMNGSLAGKKLSEIIRNYPTHYLGNSDKDCFPILVSFLYAEQNLSVQVHPDNDYALKHDDDYGKSESWYILNAKKDAKLNYGHTFKSKDAYKQAVENNRVEEHLQYITVSADDFIFVPPGTLHTITPGVFMIEIQQTSDVTYRVYDWNREQTGGSKRELHVNQASDVLIYEKQTVPETRKTIKQTSNLKQEQLINDQSFTIDKFDISQKFSLSLGIKGQPDVLICARGEGSLIYRNNEHIKINPGDTILVPSDLHNYQMDPKGDMTLLRVYYEQ